MQSYSQLHAAARAMAEQGIAVFPCVPGGKAPATENGFYDATTDLDSIDAWWTEADYNLAICPNDAGWCVIDLDPPVGESNWEALLAQEGIDEPVTRIVRTPRGGRHLYFVGELPSSASRIGRKIDTRGRGGYVLLPPSVVGGRAYEFETEAAPAPCPAFVQEQFRSGRVQAQADPEVSLDQVPNITRAISLLTAYVERGDVAIEGQGGDDRTYRLCAEVLNLGLSDGTALALISDLWNPHCQPPWEEHELETKVYNAGNHAQNDRGSWAVATAGTTFADGLRSLPAKVEAPERQSAFKLETWADIKAHKPPEWLIPHVIPERSTALLVGITGHYKTFIALDAALCVGSSLPCFGAAVSGGKVVYATREGYGSIGKRIEAWLQAKALADPANFYLTHAPRIAFDGEVQEFGDSIRKAFGAENPVLIILDTAAKCMVGLNENDARDVNRFIEFCDSLVEEFKCSVLALHHKSDKASAADIRGNSAFRAGFDTYLEIKAHRETKAVEVWARQHKDADERDYPWTFEGRKVANGLYFYPTSREEHEALTRKEDTLDKAAIGAALRGLGAIGEDKGVTTSVLSSQLHRAAESDSVEATQAALSQIGRRLGSLSRTKLKAYCSASAGGIIWWLPS